MNIELLKSAAARYGTPCFVFDADALSARLTAVREILGDRIGLCYAIKANPFLIEDALPLSDLVEVCSPGELSICEAKRVPAEKILLSGVNKTREMILEALRYGVRRFSLESVGHLRLLQAACEETGLRVDALLRLTAGSQFGMDESDLRDVIAGRDRYPLIHFSGIHSFAGTQRSRLSAQQKELEKLAALMDSLESDYGFVCERLEYGPGLYFPYFSHEDASDTLAPLRELAPFLQTLSDRTHITIEAGRFFAAPCGTYLTAVNDVKLNRGTAYAILDGGIHQLNYYGGNMGMRVPRLRQLTGSLEPQTDWCLCGSLCTTADVLVRSVPLGPLKAGDLIAFPDTGAYSVTEGALLFLSRDLPVVLAVRGGELTLLRDTVPAWPINMTSENH